MQPVLSLLLALALAGCGASDPGPQFTPPGVPTANGTVPTPPVTTTGGTIQLPPVPSGLVAAAGNAQVMLTWSASAGATAYNVSRSVMSGGPWISVAQPATNAYTDTGLTNGVPYYYVVAAINSAGASANSTEVTATPTSAASGVIVRVPPVPTGLQATAGNAQVMLTWMVSTGATSYSLSRSTQSAGPWTQVAAPTTNAYTDTGLTNGTPYYYVVAAVDTAGTSSNSAPISATPVAPLVNPGTGVGAGYWHTSGNKILDSNGTPVRIAGINWYGFETRDFLVHGLYAQDYRTILTTIKSLGYNVIRIPFSNELVESDPVPTNFTISAGGKAANTALIGQTALTDLDTIVSYAGALGLRIILDNHRSEAGNSNEASGLWYTNAYPQASWLADWQTMAARYSSPKFTFNGNPTVIGVDLRNEPHLLGAFGSSGSCWTGDTATNGCPTSLISHNWPVAAEAAGNAILAINPKLLVFVEGNDCYNRVCGWQGGNLMGVATNPVVLNVPNQLVYSAHDYGPALFRQPWFNASTTATSLYAVWNQFWGYISAAGTAPVWLGEFGTGNSSDDVESPLAGSQGQWFQSLVAYLHSNPSIDWTYWALNGEDNYGLLDSQYDATPVSALKQSLLQGIQFPLGGGTSMPPN
jgi:endoglucanase